MFSAATIPICVIVCVGVYCLSAPLMLSHAKVRADHRKLR